VREEEEEGFLPLAVLLGRLQVEVEVAAPMALMELMAVLVQEVEAEGLGLDF